MSPPHLGKGNVMALVHPGKAAPVRAPREVHPLVYFIAGFGLIMLAAVTVHTVFGALL